MRKTNTNIIATVVKLAKKVLWDYDLSGSDISEIYSGKAVRGGMTEEKLKARLLNSYNWYTLVKELGFNEAKKLLTPGIIRTLFPKSLQSKYMYAARLLRE